jgi:hypothetical protein
METKEEEQLLEKISITESGELLLLEEGGRKRSVSSPDTSSHLIIRKQKNVFQGLKTFFTPSLPFHFFKLKSNQIKLFNLSKLFLLKYYQHFMFMKFHLSFKTKSFKV